MVYYLKIIANKGLFSGKQNLYKINTVNGTRQYPDCKIAYKRATSLTNIQGEQQLINTSTLKYANPDLTQEQV